MDDQKIEDIDEITNENSVEIQEEQNNTQVDDYPEISIPDNLPVAENAAQTVKEPSLVYAFGTIDYDFVSETRYNYFEQAMKNGKQKGIPSDPIALLNYLDGNEYEATAVTWTLNIDEIPIYAIRPGCPYANIVYQKLREYLKKKQEEEETLRISIPGHITGRVSLRSGLVIPVITPELRGMRDWTSEALRHKATESDDKGKIRNFLERIYYDMRNNGRLPNNRAINFAVTDGFLINNIFEDAWGENMEMGDVDAVPSPVIYRPGSDCWDVKMIFFDPQNREAKAKRVYRYTIDVSDVIPVALGEVRSWSVYE
ncbi:MAG: hypothetical protein GY795_45540 [Desulfobacterales bacterium]|nr:hypothetical protein [Desulfobacterales bacterium]